MPGFEDQVCYAGVTIPGQEPILYLQSVIRPDLCLITLPARVFFQDYRLELSSDDLEALEMPGSAEPQIGSEVACQVIVTVDESREPSANLAAPLVINLSNHLGVQSFQAEAGYSFRHLLSETQLGKCS
jgi:flagellar assembly factor FliW